MRRAVTCSAIGVGIAIAACVGDTPETTGAPGGADAAPDAASSNDAIADAPAGDASTCFTAHADARWRGEMNAKDDTGTYDGTATAIAYVAGRHGFAFSLDGKTSFVSADPNDALWPAASFTLEAWIKTNAPVTGIATIVSKYECGGNSMCATANADWSLHLDATGHPQFCLRASGTAFPKCLTVSTIRSDDAAWHHLVAVRDVAAAMQLVYVDGALAASQALSGDAELGAMMNDDGMSDPVTIGAERNNAGDAATSAMQRLFDGAIDEPAYYARALSAADVAGLYAARDGACP